MKKLSLILIPFLLFGDITISTQKSNQKSQSEREQLQQQKHNKVKL